MTAVDPGDVPGLLRLAQAAGGVHRLRLSRFRLLDIACAEHDTRMAQVIGTPDGPVLLAETREAYQDYEHAPKVSIPAGEMGTRVDGPNPAAGIIRWRTGVLVAVALSTADPMYDVECWRRCGHVVVWPAWIDAQLAEGRRRVLVSHHASA